MWVALAGLVLIAGVLPADARSLQQILDRGAFTICAHPDAPPYSVKLPKPGGLQIDLAKAVADRLGVELREEWVLFRRDARQVGCDAIMAGLAPEAAPAPASGPGEPRPASSGGPPGQAMSRPYVAQITRVVVHAGARPVASRDDLKGRSVAVLPASFAHYLLDTGGVPVRTLYLTEEDILAAVDAGEMDAGIVSDWSLGWYRKLHPEARLEALDRQIIDPGLDFNVAVILRGADQALLSRVNDILEGLTQDGTMQRIFRDYGIDYRPPLAR